MTDPVGASARAMWADDAASRGLGMALEKATDGRARMTMVVRPTMVNGHGIAHGGFIFTLADSAFAFACNSTGDAAVAAQCQISYLAPAREGDRLTATASEHYKAGRQGITDVTVTNQDGTVVAHFRGHSRTIPPRS